MPSAPPQIRLKEYGSELLVVRERATRIARCSLGLSQPPPGVHSIAFTALHNSPGVGVEPSEWGGHGRCEHNKARWRT